MNEENKPEGKAVEVKLREDFQSDKEEIKKMQDEARSVSPFLLELLEAEEYSKGENNK